MIFEGYDHWPEAAVLVFRCIVEHVRGERIAERVKGAHQAGYNFRFVKWTTFSTSIASGQ